MKRCCAAVYFDVFIYLSLLAIDDNQVLGVLSQDDEGSTGTETIELSTFFLVKKNGWS